MIVQRGRADIDAGSRAREVRGGQTGRFNRLPCHLHEKALLRIDLGRLARRNAEEGCVEPVDIVDGAGGERIASPWCARSRMQVLALVETLAAYLGNRTASFVEKIPEGLGGRSTGEAGGEAGDDRVACTLRHTIDLF